MAKVLDGTAKASRKTLIARVGKVYVGFALDRPQIFRMMFRPELVDISRFPETAAAGDRAYAELERFVRRIRPHGDLTTHASMCWAVVHGLACLLLDGNLEGHVRGASSRTAHVDAVLRLYARLLSGA